MDQPKVSIIIPTYNAAGFLKETLLSINEQDESNYEIIIVDDGSTDNTADIVKSLNYPKIKYIHQPNSGVSSARNKGFKNANGNFVVFFDADDKMSNNFLSSRLGVLNKYHELDYVSGPVKKFDSGNILNGNFRGTGKNSIEEILFYETDVITCPSNYMFKKLFLDKFNLLFNEELSSTADRYFLIQSGSVGKSDFIYDLAPLLYRVSENSMSHKLSEKLVKDNEVYYKKLLKNELIPLELKRNSLFLGYYILFGSYWKITHKCYSLKFAVKCFIINPFRFISKGLKRN